MQYTGANNTATGFVGIWSGPQVAKFKHITGNWNWSDGQVLNTISLHTELLSEWESQI